MKSQKLLWSSLGRVNLLFMMVVLASSNPQTYNPQVFPFTLIFLCRGSGAAAATQGVLKVDPVDTWVRLAQRVPVRIAIDNVPPGGVPLVSGLTATVNPRPPMLDEPERRGIDAVAQATVISRAVREGVAEGLSPWVDLTSVLIIPWEVSRNSLMFAETIGLVKLGHPQPDSNLSDDAKRGSPETMST